MVSKSWEIIVAGLVFIGISMYIIDNKSSDSSADTTTAMSDSVVIHVPDLKIKSITLNNLQNLENLRQLENLQELGNLEKLEKLKALANYMPVEVKNDFVKEIDHAIKEKNREMD